MPKKKVTDAVEEPAQETIPVEQALAQMPRRQGSEDLLELNDLERGVTREDSEEAKWGYLAGAVRRQQILTGIVSAGMTYTENGMPIVPIDFEGLCVKIPVREMTLIEWPEDEPIPRSVRVQIGRMLGATVTPTPSPEPEKQEPVTGSEASQADYILNTNTKKFHYPTCSSVNDMKEKNKQEFFGTRDETIALGYSPCGRCKP